ncbi:IucA/IucC family siderophore biosynthesis protein [Actinomadura sp. ATCC 31491]|uniref:IucA/IucC family siderophore biosynthesis protein n=1 Tax=Actinomadura luzonensis TaxID=2805427 RepID=A0ABT0FPM3_9ACTN|nr:IucA/IucC family protein [Actinomadura luzonensis]MCK2213871.1 IucA/IucC family siderophore biosynthesis protein [Actinomadura luzonensis]
MASTDGLLPPGGPEREAWTGATALTVTALLNCLVREVARPGPEAGAHVLPATGHVLRVHGSRFPADPELRTPRGWRPLPLDELIALTAAELRARTGVENAALPAEIRHSRDVTAVLLAARRATEPPADLYLRSEQALVAGHRYHPAPKARGGGGPREWLRYSPEVRASFTLPVLGVPAELLVEEGDPAALDALAPAVPADGLVPLPAHPWQVELLGGLRGGRLRHLGGTELRHLGETAREAVATSSIRTVYLPEADLFCKFSLDVRITNDVRRLWLRDLRRLSEVADLVDGAFDGLAEHVPRPAVLRDRGYRSAELGGDGGEALAVIVRDGLGGRLRPGLRAAQAAGISEGFPGNPLDGLDEDTALLWWERYLEHVVPPVLHAYLRHGVVLECHLQNVLVGVDARGLPAQALFRDHEGVRILAERRPGLPGAASVSRAYGWERLVYCLLVNNLLEIGGAVTERHPALRDELWARARAVFKDAGRDHADPEELRELLSGPYLPAKANLLLRWTDAEGEAMRCVPVPNPLRLFTP